MFLDARGISKRYGRKTVLDAVDLTVRQGEILSIIGPSGVGKTTLLKLFAGLEQPDAGELRFARPPSREHPVILVFQDYLLFPNMTVFDNVAFGLRARKCTKRSQRDKVMTMLGHFGMADSKDAYPATLSAGQRQRVALARAMVVNPALLLLDEPFANLDRNLKQSTAEFIRHTQKTFGITTVAVTHDQQEAFIMSDTVGVMLHGRLAQLAPARTVYDNPASLEVARFLGPVNHCTPDLAATLGLNGDAPRFIRPERLDLTASDTGPGVVTSKSFAGHYTQYSVALNEHTLTVFTTDDQPAPGDRVRITFGEHS